MLLDAFRPGADEVKRAEDLLAALREAGDRATGVAVLSDGRFVDAAMVRSARRVVDLARHYPPS